MNTPECIWNAVAPEVIRPFFLNSRRYLRLFWPSPPTREPITDEQSSLMESLAPSISGFVPSGTGEFR